MTSQWAYLDFCLSLYFAENSGLIALRSSLWACVGIHVLFYTDEYRLSNAVGCQLVGQ